MKQDRANRRHIVLLGIGHTNAHIVRMWAMHPLPDADLTCISDSNTATYSGFLPAVLAGQLPPEAMEIDLVRLCAAAGARLITDRVTGLNREVREVLFANRPAIPYDVLSVGIGSVPELPAAGVDSTSLVTIKPMRSFIDRMATAVVRVVSRAEPLQVIVVGGGAAGAEVAQCLPGLFRRLTTSDIHITLINRGDELLSGCVSRTSRRVRRLIEGRGNVVLTNHEVIQIDTGSVVLRSGLSLPADIVIWATAATAPALLSEFDLPKDDRGFLLTDQTLRSTTAEPIFAVGDAGTIIDDDVPKAGVYAVRQGPVLWDNIERQLEGRALVPFQPQKSFLKLLNMGDGTAVGEWRGFSFAGQWVLRLKQRIDQRFMDKYQSLPDQMMISSDMQCRGCGCKLGGDVLEAGLGSGSHAVRDDATAIQVGSEGSAADQVLVTTDFFSAPFRDAWLNGRIAAIHSASDIFAMGAEPFAAEAIVVLPDGDESTQRQLLHDFQDGAGLEFRRMGATITGGHTITGPRWEFGFTVFGRAIGDFLIRKQGLAVGDRLFLTKPLGSGVLMAALMRGQCRHSDYQFMIDVMLRDHQVETRIAVNCGVAAGTDITGFGLLGHLQEMLVDDVAVNLDWGSIPLMPGALEAVEQGIGSSLLPANRRYMNGVIRPPGSELDLLLDPQTCGGLLLAVPAKNADRFRHQFAEHHLPAPAEIGSVIASRSGRSQIIIQ